MLSRVLVLALALIPLTLCAQDHAAPPPLPYHCSQDGDIDPMRRAVIESTATQFVHSVLSGDAGSAWDSMTTRGQSTITRDQFVGNAALRIQPTQARNIAVQHAFLIYVVGTPAPGARVACGADVSDPVQSYRMAVVAAPEQAYVLLTADGRTAGLVFTLWLLRNGSAWKVNSFAFNVATLSGRSALQLWQVARDQHQHGHEFNATLLYFAAVQLAQRGPDFELGFAAQISQEQAQVTRPKELTGPPPFHFEGDGNNFSVLNIGATDLDGRMYLAVTYEAAPWKSTKQAERSNQVIIALITKLFPEYAEVFQGIIAQASEAGTGRTFATVSDSASRQ
jgi:hypothetical protein